MVSIFDALFRDSRGKIVIWQSPNIPLWGFIICKLLAFIIKGEQLHVGFSALGTAFIFLWSYWEITAGLSNFRKILGAAVMLTTIASFFH